MWTLKKPQLVKLIIGILAADADSLSAAREAVADKFGAIDMQSQIWPFTQTDYYKNETGGNILRQFVTIEKLIDPGKLAKVKHATNKLEEKLADRMFLDLSRPVNLDPGLIEPSKLILASTKNFSHRIYIGKKMYAEVTLVYDKGQWKTFPYTFPDYHQQCYQDFLGEVRRRLLEQLKSKL